MVEYGFHKLNKTSGTSFAGAKKGANCVQKANKSSHFANYKLNKG